MDTQIRKLIEEIKRIGTPGILTSLELIVNFGKVKALYL